MAFEDEITNLLGHAIAVKKIAKMLKAGDCEGVVKMGESAVPALVWIVLTIKRIDNSPNGLICRFPISDMRCKTASQIITGRALSAMIDIKGPSSLSSLTDGLGQASPWIYENYLWAFEEITAAQRIDLADVRKSLSVFIAKVKVGGDRRQAKKAEIQAFRIYTAIADSYSESKSSIFGSDGLLISDGKIKPPKGKPGSGDMFRTQTKPLSRVQS